MAWVCARFVRIVTSNAVPIAPETCLTVLEIAVPCACSDAGSWFRPAVVMGIRNSAIPNRLPVDRSRRDV
ncbi:hypothetical protein D3C71_1829150 [compost metagenome]